MANLGDNSGQFQIFNVDFRRFGTSLLFWSAGWGTLGRLFLIRRVVATRRVGSCFCKKFDTLLGRGDFLIFYGESSIFYKENTEFLSLKLEVRNS